MPASDLKAAKVVSKSPWYDRVNKWSGLKFDRVANSSN